MVSTWLAVSPRDEVTLSLLQQRLNDLDTGIRVVTGYTAWSLREVSNFLAANNLPGQVIFCVFDEETYNIYEGLL